MLHESSLTRRQQLCQAYEKLIFTADDPDMTYISFDFHHHTKGWTQRCFFDQTFA